MKHLRYFKESVEDIGDIKELDKDEYDEYACDHEIIDVTDKDMSRVKGVLLSMYSPEEIFDLGKTECYIKGVGSYFLGIMALVAVDKEIIDREKDGEDIIYFLKFDDHYWLVCHQRNSWDSKNRYWLVGDEDLDKLKNVIFE